MCTFFKFYFIDHVGSFDGCVGFTSFKSQGTYTFFFSLQKNKFYLTLVTICCIYRLFSIVYFYIFVYYFYVKKNYKNSNLINMTFKY